MSDGEYRKLCKQFRRKLAETIRTQFDGTPESFIEYGRRMNEVAALRAMIDES